MSLLSLLEVDHPILEAPMAGVPTPTLAAAVSNAGGLGAIGVGNVDASAAAKQVVSFREQSSLTVSARWRSRGSSRERSRSR